jgi:hypothetical protein
VTVSAAQLRVVDTRDGRLGGLRGAAAQVGGWPGLVAAVVAALIGLAPLAGGLYSVSQWGPIGVVLFLFVMIVAGATHLGAGIPTTGLVGLGAIAVLAAFQYASRWWADSADQAMVDAHRTAALTALYGLLLVLLRDRKARRAALVAFGLTGALVALITTARLLDPHALGSLFVRGRLNGPLGYFNGQAAFLFLVMWALLGGAEGARNRIVAAIAAGGATFVAALALLAQSRGSLIGIAAAAAVCVFAVPGRPKRLVFLALVACGVAGAAGSMLAVLPSSGDALALPHPHAVRVAVLAAALAATGVGLAWLVLTGMTGLGSRLRARIERPGGRAGLIGGSLAVIAVAAIVGAGPAARAIERNVDTFTSLSPPSDQSRLASVGGNRYDYWRVAVNEFRDHPLAGVGAGNYDAGYFRERRTTEDVRQPHSLLLQALAETGVIGAVLVVLFLGSLGAALLSAARRSSADAWLRASTAAAAGMVTLWVVQTNVDWLHLIPGITGAMLLAGALLVHNGAGVPAVAARRGPRWRPLVFAGATLAAGSLAVLVWSDHLRADAQSALARDPAAALAKARSSLELNDQALAAYYVLAAAQAREGRYASARRTLHRAEVIEPHDFLPPTLLGDLAVRRGDFAQARVDYRRALSLNPLNAALESAVRDPRALAP